MEARHTDLVSKNLFEFFAWLALDKMDEVEEAKKRAAQIAVDDYISDNMVRCGGKKYVSFFIIVCLQTAKQHTI